MKSVFYKRILLPTQDLTASVSSQPTIPTPTNPVAVSYTICGNYKLYGLTNYLDTFNATTKVITHKIGIKVLDGTENWTKRSDTGVNRYQANILNDKVSGTINGLSSHFVSVLAYSQLLDGCFILDATDRVVFDKEDITTASAFKSYLAQQYANGTPVIIYYPLATETTETATEPLERVETKSFVQYKANPEYRNLPSGYTQFEYLQSDGSQYIDLDFIATSNTDYEMDLQINASDSNGIFGSRNSSTNRHFFLTYMSRWDILFNTDWFLSDTSTIPDPQTNKDYHIEITRGENNLLNVSINGETASQTVNCETQTFSSYLFAVNNRGTKQYGGKLKIKSFKIKENGVLIRNLIPASNGITNGMYDIVNNVFYTNSGTGNFIAVNPVSPLVRVDEKGFAMYQLNPNWHDLPSGYTELEYLQSSGTQWIDTGVILTQNSDLVLDFSSQEVAATKGFFGEYGNDNHTFELQTGGGAIYFYYTNSLYLIFAHGYSFDRCILKTENNHIYKDGTDLGSFTRNFSFDKTLLLFTLRLGNDINRYCSKMTCYSCKLYENNTLVRNLIPARNSNNILGMYDLVSGQFYTNAGTGTFTAGNIVPKYIKHGG